MPEEITIAPVTGEIGRSLDSFTFPSYRHLLDLTPNKRYLNDPSEPTIEPTATAAWVDSRPVGLVLATMPLQADRATRDPELLSLLVSQEWRNHGIATRLVEAIERAVRACGFERLGAVWMTGKPGIPAVERVLQKRGWTAPATRTVTLRFSPEEATRTPWFRRVKLPTDRFQIVAWSEVTSEERALVRSSHETRPWIARGLEPWRHDSYGYDPISSVAMRFDGTVVGWVINHRISPTTVRFTCSFMRKDLSRRGRIMPLYTESLLRLAAAGIEECTLVTPLEYTHMAEFVRRRCATWAHFYGETRGSVKLLSENGPEPTNP
jgi:GNAT superfamily N-acetyltransferase